MKINIIYIFTIIATILFFNFPNISIAATPFIGTDTPGPFVMEFERIPVTWRNIPNSNQPFNTTICLLLERDAVPSQALPPCVWYLDTFILTFPNGTYTFPIQWEAFMLRARPYFPDWFVFKAFRPTGNGQYETLATSNHFWLENPSAELKAATPTTSPSRVVVGTPIELSSVISNTGNIPTPTSFSNFFRVSNGFDGSGSTNIDLPPETMNILAKQATDTTRKNYPFTSVGRYSVKACADKTSSTGGGVIPETNEDDNCSSWANIEVNPPAPVVTLSVNPSTGIKDIVRPVITWTTTNTPTSCAASGDWSGSKAVGGGSEEQGVLNETKNYTYTLTCENTEGRGNPSSAIVSVGADLTYYFLSPLPCDNNAVPSIPGCVDGKLLKFDPAGGAEGKPQISSYLNLIIKIFIGICAVLAVIMIIMGGIEYMSSDLISSKEQGRNRITGAILGLILALGAWTLLNTINSDILKTDSPIFNNTTN